ncbi:MAG TPA: nucleotide pyrophosphohydrolase [Thermopetrobacter sp.]|nr:nucleotide pyrophosphohydrolase [Thermopetrobacter sp.]
MSDNRQGPTLRSLTERLIAFRDARDWARFHTLKDLLLSLSLEAAEALELAQWKREEELDAALREDDALRARLREECADVLLYLLLIAEKADFDLAAAAAEKIALNEKKYPADKARGRADKYTEL